MNEARAKYFGKYTRLWSWLVAHDAASIELAFADVENVLLFRLPPSARRQTSFWLSHKGSSLGRAVHSAGWRIRRVDLEAERLILEPVGVRLKAVGEVVVEDGRMYELDSTLLAKANYDSMSSVLTVILNDGSAYQYDRVPRGVVAGLLAAPSPGQFFLAHIRKAYQARRVH